MLAQPTVRRDPVRRNRLRRPAPRVQSVGQFFDVEATPDAVGWTVHIPELHATTHAWCREAVETAARTTISERTGLPAGYVLVLVRD